jgi:probable HAF family extracellular repeat protein
LLLCGWAPAQTVYNYKSFNTPGATVTRVFGINDRGYVVGTDNSVPGRHAFLLSPKSYVALDPNGVLGANPSFARGINNEGQIVGGYFDENGNEHGFIWRNDEVTVLDAPFEGSQGTQLNAINDSGTIVGVWVDAAFTAHGFVYRNGRFEHLDYPGALDTFPMGINPQGDIVGNWDTDQSTVGHAFVFSRGRIFSFDVPGSAPDASAANGINARGQIVGTYLDADGNSHGFLANGAIFARLDCPGALRTAAWAINADARIAGTCDSVTQHLGYIASPSRDPRP